MQSCATWQSIQDSKETFHLEIVCHKKSSFAVIQKFFFQLSTSGGHIRCTLLILWTILLLYIRFLTMQHSLPDFSNSDNPAANSPNILTRFWTFLYLPFCNLYLLVYPWQLSYDWSIDAIPLVERVMCWENVCSLLMYTFLAYMLLLYIKFCQFNIHIANDSRSINLFDLMVFGVAVMILPFLPAINLFFYVGFIVAERVLYIPSIGFCLLFVNGLTLMVKKSKHPKWLYGAAALTFIFALQTYKRNFVWKDEESLYRFVYV